MEVPLTTREKTMGAHDRCREGGLGQREICGAYEITSEKTPQASGKIYELKIEI
jgi:hypothetical protein